MVPALHHAAGLAHHQHARSEVVQVQRQLQIRAVAARGHQAQVIGRGAQAAQVVDRRAQPGEQPQHPGTVVLVAMGERRAHYGLGKRLPPHVQRRSVAGGAVAAAGEEHLFGQRAVHAAQLQHAVQLIGDGHGIGHDAVNEVGGAVDGIHDEPAALFAGLTALLAVERVLRVFAQQRLADHPLAEHVHFGDEIVHGLALHAEPAPRTHRIARQPRGVCHILKLLTEIHKNTLLTLSKLHGSDIMETKPVSHGIIT